MTATQRAMILDTIDRKAQAWGTWTVGQVMSTVEDTAEFVGLERDTIEPMVRDVIAEPSFAWRGTLDDWKPPARRAGWGGR